MSIFSKLDGYFLMVLLGCSGGIAFAAQIDERIRLASDSQHVPAIYTQQAATETLFSDMCADISRGDAWPFDQPATAETENFSDLVTEVCNSKKSVAELTPAKHLSVLTFSKAI